MNSLSLAVNGGSEKWLGSVGSQPSWGFMDPVMTYRSREVSTFVVSAPGILPEAVPPIAADSIVIVYDGRTYSGGFSGGNIIFVGRLTSLDGLADASAPGLRLTFSDVWYDLRFTTFQHHWEGAFTPGSSTITTQYFSRILLFQDISAGPGAAWGYLTTQAQIQEILTYAGSTCGLAVQYGVIDPTFNQPFYPCRAVQCDQALLLCLRPVPDAITWIDYTTSPPKLQIRQRAALIAAGAATINANAQCGIGKVTLPYADGTKHKSSRIKPRPDLIPDSVVIQYQKVNQVNGSNYVNTVLDAYPAGHSGNAFRAIVCPIDLRGGNRSDISATVTALAIDPTTAGFWQAKKPDLNLKDDSGNALITGLSVDSSSITVVDDSGTDLTSTWLANWPNELQPGSGVASWMYDGGGNQIVAKHVTISAKVSYKRQVSNTNTNALHQADVHPVSVRVRLTNSAAGTVTYTAIKHLDPGDPAITGLAQAIYTGLATLQYEGTHTIVERSISTYYTPGNVLNLSGGAAAWATMNAQIYSCEYDFFRGKTTIEFGPHRNLTSEEFFQVISAFRTRLVYDSPNLRNTGVDTSAGASANLPEDNAKENTNAGLPQQSVHTVISQPDATPNYTVIQHATPLSSGVLDASITLQKQDASGTLIPTPTYGQVVIALSACLGSDGNYHKVYLQEVAGCDAMGNPKKAIALISDLY